MRLLMPRAMYKENYCRERLIEKQIALMFWDLVLLQLLRLPRARSPGAQYPFSHSLLLDNKHNLFLHYILILLLVLLLAFYRGVSTINEVASLLRVDGLISYKTGFL